MLLLRDAHDAEARKRIIYSAVDILTFTPTHSALRTSLTDMYTWIRDRVAPVERGFSMQRRHRSQGVLRPRWPGWRACSEYSTSTRNAIVIKIVQFRVLKCLLYK